MPYTRDEFTEVCDEMWREAMADVLADALAMAEVCAGLRRIAAKAKIDQLCGMPKPDA